MNPRICMVRHDPPASFGDCISACIKTILDRDDVPHVFDGRPILDAWSQLRSWLQLFGKTIAIFPMDQHAEFMAENNPGVIYVLFCGTNRGDHAVVCQDGQIIHDPAWYKAIITGHHSMGCYIVGIVGDLV